MSEFTNQECPQTAEGETELSEDQVHLLPLVLSPATLPHTTGP